MAYNVGEMTDIDYFYSKVVGLRLPLRDSIEKSIHIYTDKYEKDKHDDLSITFEVFNEQFDSQEALGLYEEYYNETYNSIPSGVYDYATSVSKLIPCNIEDLHYKFYMVATPMISLPVFFTGASRNYGGTQCPSFLHASLKYLINTLFMYVRYPDRQLLALSSHILEVPFTREFPTYRIMDDNMMYLLYSLVLRATKEATGDAKKICLSIKSIIPEFYSNMFLVRYCKTPIDLKCISMPKYMKMLIPWISSSNNDEVNRLLCSVTGQEYDKQRFASSLQDDDELKIRICNYLYSKKNEEQYSLAYEVKNKVPMASCTPKEYPLERYLFLFDEKGVLLSDIVIIDWNFVPHLLARRKFHIVSGYFIFSIGIMTQSLNYQYGQKLSPEPLLRSLYSSVLLKFERDPSDAGLSSIYNETYRNRDLPSYTSVMYSCLSYFAEAVMIDAKSLSVIHGSLSKPSIADDEKFGIAMYIKFKQIGYKAFSKRVPPCIILILQSLKDNGDISFPQKLYFYSWARDCDINIENIWQILCDGYKKGNSRDKKSRLYQLNQIYSKDGIKLNGCGYPHTNNLCPNSTVWGLGDQHIRVQDDNLTKIWSDTYGIKNSTSIYNNARTSHSSDCRTPCRICQVQFTGNTCKGAVFSGMENAVEFYYQNDIKFDLNKKPLNLAYEGYENTSAASKSTGTPESLYGNVCGDSLMQY
jgi:hypothetical protein